MNELWKAVATVVVARVCAHPAEVMIERGIDDKHGADALHLLKCLFRFGHIARAIFEVREFTFPGAQATSLFFSAACRKVLVEKVRVRFAKLSLASCRRLQAGSLRSPDLKASFSALRDVGCAVFRSQPDSAAQDTAR